MKKRILLVLALLSIFAQGAMADEWNGRSKKKPQFHVSTYDGSYHITCAAELAYVRAHFSEATGDTNIYAPKYWYEASFDLFADLDFDHRGWHPIGNNDGSPVDFNGTFRGNGHSITISLWDEGRNYQGLFARIGERGQVEGVKITGRADCQSARLVGGIAGENLGTIRNCWVAANVSSGWRESWSAYTAKVGGIVGENSGTIEYCLMSGNVTNNDADVGGLVGYNKGYVAHCTFYGTRNSSHSQHSIYFGDVSGSATDWDIHGDDLSDDAALETHLVNHGVASNGLYADGLRAPFTIAPHNWGTVFVLLNTSASRPGKTITVSYPEGGIVSFMEIKDADANFLKYDYDAAKRTYSFTMPKSDVDIYATINYPVLLLSSDVDNSEQLSVRKGKICDATLTDRTLYHDDSWNTLCLPFAVPRLDGTPLEKATVQELTNASIEGGTLTLTFSPVTSIEAGKPYIIKWKSGRNTVKPKFWGVTPVSTEPIPVSFGGVTFTGQYSAFNITSDNINDIIILGEKNTLGYSAAPRQLGAFRAHFTVPAGSGARAITKVVIK